MENTPLKRDTDDRPDALNATRCPICEQSNHCAMTNSDQSALPSSCWCETETFSADLLAQLSTKTRSKVCICPACAAESRPIGPVRDASTWKSNVARKDWQFTLTKSELTELESATRQACKNQLEPTQFSRSDFALPTLGPRLGQIVNGVENGIGFALIQGIPVHQYDEHTLKVLYWGLGCYLGDPISQNSKGERLAEVSDRGNSYQDRNARGFASKAELVPHMDTSDMTALLCVRQAKQGGESRVVSATDVYNTILAEHPTYLDPLFDGFHNDLRGEGPTADINELSRRRVPVFSYYANRLSCSFNMRMIDNAFVKANVQPTPLARQALDFLRDVTLRENTGIRFSMRPGDIQLVSNYSVFHSRTQFEDHAAPAQRRCLYRLWLNLFNGRALAPRFADRYNTGPRGGVAVGTGAQYKF